MLARKGGAKPAMRPQHAALASMPTQAPDADDLSEQLEDLGWNDMGDGDAPTAEIVQLTPMPRHAEAEAATVESARPAIVHQQESLADRIAAPAPAPRKPAATRARPGSRAAFTLRLDPERHLKLRLATTIRGVSAQSLVTEALDILLGDMPELDTLAAQVKRR
nr:hypothetical protein [Tsuneonella aeria]